MGFSKEIPHHLLSQMPFTYAAKVFLNREVPPIQLWSEIPLCDSITLQDEGRRKGKISLTGFGEEIKICSG